MSSSGPSLPRLQEELRVQQIRLKDFMAQYGLEGVKVGQEMALGT